jgi:hypothetical protein
MMIALRLQAKREETAKKIQDLKLKAKDPTTRAKIEKELKLAADEEVMQLLFTKFGHL